MSIGKKMSLFFGFFLAVLMLSCLAARGDASKSGCTHSHDRAKGCSDDPAGVPEPGMGSLIVAGMILVGGAAVLNRRRMIRS